MKATKRLDCACGCGRNIEATYWQWQVGGPFYFSNACQQRVYHRQRIKRARAGATSRRRRS